jgi:serine/threonine-protein kinase
MITMEFLDGQPLNAIRRKLGADLPIDIQVRIYADVLCGLHYAHELQGFDKRPMGIVHRDVSPQNLFVTYDGAVKVLDFGIAKIANSSHVTQAGVIKGKIGYMAPEQVFNKGVDRRADIFAIGAMLWETLAKRRLVLPGTEDLVAMQARISGEIPSLASLAPSAPPALAAIAERALSVDPAARYATAEEMQHALEEYLRGATNPHAPEIAKYLRTAFAEEREALRNVIEQQLTEPDASVPVLLTASGTGSFVTAHDESAESATSLLATTDASRAKVPPASRRTRAALGLLLAAVVGLASLGMLGIRKSKPPAETTASASSSPTLAPSSSAQPQQQTSAAPALSATEVRKVRIVVTANPNVAHITLDGEPLQSGEPALRDASTRDKHVLRVSAPGYTETRRELVFDQDQTLAVALAPTNKHGTAPPAASTRATAAATSPASTPTGTATKEPPALNDAKKQAPRGIDTAAPF